MPEKKYNVYSFRWDKPQKPKKVASKLTKEEACKVANKLVDKKNNIGAYIAHELDGREEDIIW